DELMRIGYPRCHASCCGQRVERWLAIQTETTGVPYKSYGRNGGALQGFKIHVSALILVFVKRLYYAVYFILYL
ncbi:MAG: hypothetical protein ACJA04_000118, partial [Cellvibrionaceae bacterium]